jgi:hypothetical protein
VIEKYYNPYSTKTDLTPQYIVDELGRKRLANTEFVLPVCIGQ